jgi:hypothetical protein
MLGRKDPHLTIYTYTMVRTFRPTLCGKKRMYLGIDQQTGLIYEGSGNPDIPTLPLPAVTQAKLIETPEDWTTLPNGLSGDPMHWMFREDSFDAATRIRRGRLYQPWQTQPSNHRVAPHPYDDPMRRAVGADGMLQKSLNVYTTCSELLNKPGKGLGATLALGSTQGASAWRIIQTEVLASRAVMVTLKALSSYGILPDIDAERIDPEFRPPVAQAINRVLDSAFRESPISVIDHCRNAITVILSRWMVQAGQDAKVLTLDLAKVSEALEAEPHRKYCAANLGKVVALLHNRGKGNMQHSLGARAPLEEDAEMSLQALGFVLRDIGWAKDDSFPLRTAT